MGEGATYGGRRGGVAESVCGSLGGFAHPGESFAMSGEKCDVGAFQEGMQQMTE